MIPLSVLDLAPIVTGKTAGDALRESLLLARHVERLGYHRFWLAEHHNMPGIASAATSVVLAHVAAGTERIRVGAGGVMLPNHAPLVIAEQFGTLAALHPGRIDLGIGRAPGTHQLTARALRRTLTGDVDQFPEDVIELMRYFRPEPGQRIHAYPGAGEDVPLWILGSSLFGAELAAVLGLPYAFASHFAPQMRKQAVALYRARFRPSPQLAEPYVMLGLNIFAAGTTAEARVLQTSVQQAFVQLRRGTPTKLLPPDPDLDAKLTPIDRAMLDQALSFSIVGDEDTVHRELGALIAEERPDELIVVAQIYDHEARLRSYEIAARAHARLSG